MAMVFVDFEAPQGGWFVSLRYADAGATLRRVVTPKDDISALPKKARDAIAAHWAALDPAGWEALDNPLPEPVTPAAVKIEALARIAAALAAAGYEDRGDMAMAFIVADKAGDAETKAAVTALFQHLKTIRAAGIALAQQTPIPADYTADARWPAG